MSDEEPAVMTMPCLEPTASSEIEAMIMHENVESGEGIYRPILIADASTELELTIEDAERLHLFLTDALAFLEGRKLGLM